MFRQLARFRRKLATISALTALADNRQFTRIAQNYAVRVSDFVRKCFSRVLKKGNHGNTNQQMRGN
ncbi:MAG: hypothetical protein AUG90_00770 [Verrucomicrobia bacterium 13_1_20CM_4_55_9]|nr:MAG: hypothetical protein AUG90_00770 [Verrucomicrobia bacterium 13_1_20CM_4_55_9]